MDLRDTEPMADLQDRHRELAPLVEIPRRRAMDAQDRRSFGEAHRRTRREVDQIAVASLAHVAPQVRRLLSTREANGIPDTRW